MNVVFLFPYPPGVSPSQRFRFEQYLPLLEASGVQLYTQSFWDEKVWGILYKKKHLAGKTAGFIRGVFRRLRVLGKILWADRVFIHRECLPVGPPVFEWIIARVFRKKIIFDFDDAIWLPNTSHENSMVALIKWHSKTRAICRWSTVVSCGNQYLADYARQVNNNVVLNPTTIDTEHLHNPSLHPLPSAKKQITLGWTGTHSTLKYLDDVLPALQKLEARYGDRLRFVIIANKKPVLPLNNMVFINWTKEKEIEDLLQLDIGIMPLTDDVWAKGKCGFKALQYMALQIPAVASPVGVNTEIITQGENGYLCATIEEWFRTLDMLIQDEPLRMQTGKAGRQKIRTHYSVSSNTPVFLSLFA